MNEEHLTILRMIAEKKITAEEGERLLEALGSETATAPPPPGSERREKTAEGDFSGKKAFDFSFDFGKKGTLSGFKMFGKKGTFDSDVFRKKGEKKWKGAFGEKWKDDKEDPFDFDASPQTIPAPQGTTLSIKTNSGSLKLLATDETEIRVEGPLKRQYTISQSESEVAIRAKKFGVSLTVHVPKAVGQVNVRSNLGDVTAQGLSNNIEVDANVGKVEMSAITSSNVLVRTNTGEITLDVGAITQGKVHLASHVGGVRLRLSPASAFEVRAVVDQQGEVRADLPLQILDEGPGFLRGTLNGGGADIRLKTNTGEIYIGPSEGGRS